MGPRSITYKHVVLQGANADLWDIAHEHAPELCGTEAASEALAEALGASQDNVRVARSKKIIDQLWRHRRVLGPYPFLETLSKFEFDRVFYAQYRDHVCHQLKVYLLGLGIYGGCERVRDAIDSQLGGRGAFELAWLVTAVFHDVGYVVEADRAGPGDELWIKVGNEYAKTMQAPLAATGLFPALTADKEVVGRRDRVPDPRLGYQIGDLDTDELFTMFAEAAESAGLSAQTLARPAIQAYWDFARQVSSARPPFRDHGVASALMLMRHWRVFDVYIDNWQRAFGGKSVAGVDAVALAGLETERANVLTLVKRAAGAMSIHNVAPQLWKAKWQEAVAAGLDFERFRIALAKGTPRANGLAFLLGLVDTLQDWDRPTFGDQPRAGALLGDDLSVRVSDQRVRVHVVSDHEEFRHPATSRHSRYGAMMSVLCEYLDGNDVDALVAWSEERGADHTPSFEKTLTTLLGILKEISPPIRDEEAVRVVESAMSLFKSSPIAQAAVRLANRCLPSCYSIRALDVLGPEAWAAPTAFQYLASQLRHYARANVVGGVWNLQVSETLDKAIHRALGNARARGMEQSLTLFDNPLDFTWGQSVGRPALEYGRILLWSKDELCSRIANIVIDTHITFHVPLFFLEFDRVSPERQFDFICFRCASPTEEWEDGAANEQSRDGRFEFRELDNGMIRAKRATSYFDKLLARPDLMFAVDARELAMRERQ